MIKSKNPTLRRILFVTLLLPAFVQAQQVTADPAIGSARFTQNTSATIAGPYIRNTEYTVLINVRNNAGTAAIPANAFSVVVQLGRGVKFAGPISALSSNYTWTVDTIIDPSQAIVRGILKNAVPASYNQDIAVPIKTVDGCMSNAILLTGININPSIITNGNDFLNDDANLQYSVYTPIDAGCIGGTIRYAAAIVGSSYQWQENNGTGFINITDNAIYMGTATDTLVIQNADGTLSGTRYRCVVQTSSGLQYSAEQTVRFENRWNGLGNTNWHNPLNWSCCQVPDQYTDATISGTKNRYPAISGDAEAKSVKVDSGATVTVKNGVLLEIKGR